MQTAPPVCWFFFFWSVQDKYKKEDTTHYQTNKPLVLCTKIYTYEEFYLGEDILDLRQALAVEIFRDI